MQCPWDDVARTGLARRTEVVVRHRFAGLRHFEGEKVELGELRGECLGRGNANARLSVRTVRLRGIDHAGHFCSAPARLGHRDQLGYRFARLDHRANKGPVLSDWVAVTRLVGVIDFDRDSGKVFYHARDDRPGMPCRSAPHQEYPMELLPLSAGPGDILGRHRGGLCSSRCTWKIDYAVQMKA